MTTNQLNGFPIISDHLAIAEEVHLKRRELLEQERKAEQEARRLNEFEKSSEGELEAIQNTLTEYLSTFKNAKTTQCPHCRDLEIVESHQKVCLPCVLSLSGPNDWM